jgi:hypothetical protein
MRWGSTQDIMKTLHFDIAHRTKGTQQGPAQAHVRYITRAGEGAGAEAHAAYVTRTTQQLREDLIDTGTGNLPAWANGNPVTFFAAADQWERVNGRTATQLTAALPRELSPSQQRDAVEAFVSSQLGTRHAYVWGMHETTASDGGKYPHVHIAFSERADTGQPMDPQQYFSNRGYHKDRMFNDKSWIQSARQGWSDTLNVALEQAGVAERVNAQSFRDLGIQRPGAEYIPRQILQRHPELLEARGRFDDTDAMRGKRQEAWEARKQVLGITPDMDRETVIQRIGEATRARVATEKNERFARAQAVRTLDPVELEKRATMKRDRLAEVNALKLAEAHYVSTPSQIRTTSHLAAVARVLAADDTDHGKVRRRTRTRDEDQDRSRTYAQHY